MTADRPSCESACKCDPPKSRIGAERCPAWFEPEYREMVFKLFQRLHDDEAHPGTGIGLARVKKSAELLGGTVWMEPSPTGGSTFFVRLPRGGTPDSA